MSGDTIYLLAIMGGSIAIIVANLLGAWAISQRQWARFELFLDRMEERLNRMEARLEKSIAESRAQSEKQAAELYATKKELGLVQAQVDEQGRAMVGYHQEVMAGFKGMKGELH